MFSAWVLALYRLKQWQIARRQERDAPIELHLGR